MIRWLLAAGLTCMSASTLRAETIAITHARLYPISHAEPIEDGTVVVSDGRIAAVGRSVAIPPGARIIDAQGNPVTPGLFNAFTFVSLMDIGDVASSNDISAGNAVVSAALDVRYGINPMAAAIPVTRLEGVTRLMVTPLAENTLFGGFGALIHTGTGPQLPQTDPVFKLRAFQYVELGEAGGRLAGGSRPAAFAVLLNALREARLFEANRSRYLAGNDREALVNHVDAEALISVVNGQVPLLVHVDRAVDIRNVLSLRQQFPALRLILLGVAEGWIVADEIAAARVPAIVWALDNLPARFEQLGATMANAGRMIAKGVIVALGSGPSRDEGFQARLLPQLAGNLVAMQALTDGGGLTHDQALRAITLAPAQVFGVDKDLGSLEAGKIADVVIWNGDPLEVTSAPITILVNGVEMPMVSRQTELRDRYLSLAKKALPFQYRQPK